MLPRSVLSPVDFSEHSRHALRWAGAFAARFQSRLTVISVVDPLLAEAARIRLGKDLAKAETEPALRGFVAATWSEGGARPPDQTVVKTTVGEPATAILAVPSPSSDSDVESQHQGFEISHILAATDFSESSVAAAQAAVELSMRWSAPLTLVHVLAPLKVPAQWQPLVQESEEMRVASARTALKTLAGQLCGTRVCEDLVVLGHPAEMIGSIARDRGTQLVVMGLASERGVFAPRPGSIAYRVLCSSTVPVLVVPTSDK